MEKQKEQTEEISLQYKSKRIRGIDTRKRIMAAARKTFSQNGFAAANVSDIVADAGVSQGTFYYHYADKKAILTEILDEFTGAMKVLVDFWAETRDASNKTIEAFARSVAILLYENHDIVMIMKNETNGPDKEIGAKIRDFYQYVYQRQAQALELGQRLGLVRSLDCRVAAVAQIGMIKEVVEDAVERDKVDIDYLIAQITELIYFGIRPGG